MRGLSDGVVVGNGQFRRVGWRSRSASAHAGAFAGTAAELPQIVSAVMRSVSITTSHPAIKYAVTFSTANDV